MKTEVFLKQAEFIGKRFVEKGYQQDFINEKIEVVSALEREKLIQDSTRNKELLYGVPLMMDYNVQYKQIETICKKYWNIIKADRHLGTILPEKPKFTYHRAPTLRDIIAKNVLDPPAQKAFNGKGLYPCKTCYTKESKKKKESFKSTVTGNE